MKTLFWLCGAIVLVIVCTEIIVDVVEESKISVDTVKRMEKYSRENPGASHWDIYVSGIRGDM
jgi:hypothetical protein